MWLEMELSLAVPWNSVRDCVGFGGRRAGMVE